MTTNEVKCLVIDHGLFQPIAQRLARDFAKVYYYSPSEKAFPTVCDIVGDGFADIERVNDLWRVKNEVDLWCVPDIGFSGIQSELLSQGCVVWGARDGDVLEISRRKFLNTLKESTDLPVPEYEIVVGLSKLMGFLHDKEDYYVKISKYRGDWETLHWRSWEQDEMTLDAKAVTFGPWKESIVFYCFPAIESLIEDGCDTYCVDGKFPQLCIHGQECKDRSYFGTFQKANELPAPVQKVQEQMGPILEGFGYRSFFSSEVRVTEDDVGYFLDPTCRAGSPPSQVQCEMIANYGDVIWQGAQGNLIEPVPAAPYGVQALLTVKSRKGWNAVPIPDSIRQWVKCGFCSQIDGRLVFAPDSDNTTCDIGWLTAIGESPKAAIDTLKEYAKELPDGVTAHVESLADLLSEMEHAEDAGVPMTNGTLPPPEIAIQKA